MLVGGEEEAERLHPSTTAPSFKKKKTKRAEECVRKVQHRLELSKPGVVSRLHLTRLWLPTCTGLCLSWSGTSTESAPQTPSMTCFIWWDSYHLFLVFTLAPLTAAVAVFLDGGRKDVPPAFVSHSFLAAENRKLWVIVVSQSWPVSVPQDIKEMKCCTLKLRLCRSDLDKLDFTRLWQTTLSAVAWLTAGELSLLPCEAAASVSCQFQRAHM